VSQFKKWVKVDGVNIATLIPKNKGSVYITDIVAGQVLEKKKVYVDVPFKNGQIDVSYAYGNINFYNDVPLTITLEIVGKVDKGRTTSTAMEIYQKLKLYIANKIGTMEIETSDEHGVLYQSTHLNIECTKGTQAEHLIVTCNFNSYPIKIKRVGGEKDYISCLDFDSMSLGECWNSAFYVVKAIIGKRYFFQIDGEVKTVNIVLSEQATVTINDTAVVLQKGSNDISVKYFKKGNVLMINKAVEMEVYYTYETL